MAHRFASKCRCVGNQDSGHQLCQVTPNLPYDPYFGVEDEDEKKVLTVILKSHLKKEELSHPSALVLPLERHDAPPRAPRLRYKVCEGVYGKRPMSSASPATRDHRDKGGMSWGADTPAGLGVTRPLTAGAVSPSRTMHLGLDRTLVRFISSACQTEPDDYGMIQLSQAFARRALPWNAQMCPQAMEHLEALRVKAERAKEAQLVLEHQTDQVARLRDFTKVEKKKLSAWFKKRREEAAAGDVIYRKWMGESDHVEVMRTDEDWEHEAARLPAFEEAEYARVNAAETVNLENNLIAEATIKVVGFGSVNTRALKRTLEDGRLRSAEEAERFRANHVFRREDAYSQLVLRGEKAKVEVVARREQSRLRQMHSAEITSLDFAHESIAKTTHEACDSEWNALMKHERSETKRVHKQLKVQEALARASAVYVMHLLTHYSKPQLEKTNRDEMFSEIKLTTLKRKMADEQRLMDLLETERAQRNLRSLLRHFKRGVEEELRVAFERSKRSLEGRQQEGELHIRTRLKGLKDGLKLRWRAKYDKLLSHRRREEEALQAMGHELSACRELEEKEIMRLTLDAHQRRYQEDNRAQGDRQRLNYLIANWRSQFTEIIEIVRKEVVTWASEQKRSVHSWVEESGKLNKEGERKDLHRAIKAVNQEADRSAATTETLTKEVFTQMLAVLDRLYQAELKERQGLDDSSYRDGRQEDRESQEEAKLEYAFVVESSKILDKWRELWSTEIAKGHRFFQEQAEARAETIKQQEERYQTDLKAFHNAFVNSTEAYIKGLLGKNNATRSTLGDFFRTEDKIFKEMLLEEEQEAAQWQEKQEEVAHAFHAAHRGRTEHFVLQLEDFKRKAASEGKGLELLHDEDEQASQATIESLGTLVHDDDDNESVWTTEEEDKEVHQPYKEEKDMLLKSLETALRKKQDGDSLVSLAQFKTVLDDAAKAEELTAQQASLLLAYCWLDEDSRMAVTDLLLRVSVLFPALRLPAKRSDHEDEDGQADYDTALRQIAAEEARHAVGHIRQALDTASAAVSTPASPAQQSRSGERSKSPVPAGPATSAWTQERLSSMLRAAARWSPYLSQGDASFLGAHGAIKDNQVDEHRLEELLAEVRYVALHHAAAWTKEHSVRTLRQYLYRLGKTAIKNKTGNAKQVDAKQQNEEDEATTLPQEPLPAQDGSPLMMSIQEMALVLERDSYIPLSKSQRMLLLSEVGNLYSPSAMVDGHPAYSLKRWTQLLSVWLLRDLSPAHLRMIPSLLGTPDYEPLLPSSSFSNPSHRASYIQSVLAMLEPLELKGMNGQLPVTVLRQCLVSGQHIRGVRPGMADVAVMNAPLEQRQWQPLEKKDDEASAAFTKIVRCQPGEFAADYRALVGHAYDSLIMLLRLSWLSRCAAHKVEGMAASGKDSMAWTSLVTARQRRMLRRSDYMRQLMKEQWQLIHSRLVHERHARRVTSEMLLRVQDTDTTKLVEGLLKRTEEPLKNVQPEGEAVLAACVDARQKLVESFEKYRDNLDTILQEDTENALAHLSEAVQGVGKHFQNEWRIMMVNLSEIREWVRQKALEDTVNVSNWKQACISGYKNAQVEDDRCRRQDTVMLSLATADSIEGTTNFATRLTGEAEKITKDAQRAQQAKVKELLSGLSKMKSRIHEDSTNNRRSSEHTIHDEPRAPDAQRRASAVAKLSLEEVDELCEATKRRLEAISLAAHNKLAKLEAAIQEQIDLTVTQQDTRLRDFGDKQLTDQNDRYLAARQKLHDIIAKETVRYRGIHEARGPDFQGLMNQEARRLQVKWGELTIKEMMRFKSKEEKRAPSAASRCDTLAKSAETETKIVQELVNTKANACSQIILQRSTTHTNLHEEALRQASELATNELRRWRNLIAWKRIRGEVQAVVDLAASTVELKAGFEVDWQQRQAELKETLQLQGDKDREDCRGKMTEARNNFNAVVKAQEYAKLDMDDQIEEARQKLAHDLEEARNSKERRCSSAAADDKGTAQSNHEKGAMQSGLKGA